LPSMEVKNFAVVNDVTKYDLIFPRGKNIVVEAIDASDGKQIEGMRFVLEPMRAAAAPAAAGASGEESRSQAVLRFLSFQQHRSSYSFKNVPVGDYVLRALDSQKYYLADDSSSYFLKVEDDATFKVWFVKPASLIQGAFTKAPKEFLQKTAICCARSLDSVSPSFLTPSRSSMYTRPDAKGVFKLAPLPPGRYSAAVYLPQSEGLAEGVDIETLAGAPFYLYVYGGIEVVDSKGADIAPFLKQVPVGELGTPGSISGRVTTQKGEKVGRARVFVVHGPYPGFVLGRTEYRATATMTGDFLTKSAPHAVDTSADENGKFMINGLPPGSYDLLVLKTGGGLTWQGRIVTTRVSAGKKENVDVALPDIEGGKLTVTISVKDSQSNPVRCLTPRFYAFINSDRHDVAWLSAVNKEGDIKVENMPEGTLYVTLWDFRPISFAGFNREKNCSFVAEVRKDKTSFTYTLPKAR
ncbi:MAG: carboxypeptidase-like regulatory domain-containing protein, partial [Planctomycetota bacterium]|nr:carboxypeptidase-like regulatory domain-containing protein [Planctomycetota bacterium]